MIPTPDEVAELTRLLHQRYQDLGDTLARKAAWALESLSPPAGMVIAVVEAAEQAMLKGGITDMLLISSVRGAIQEVYRLSARERKE